MYKYPCLSENKSVFNWAFCQLLKWKTQLQENMTIQRGEKESSIGTLLDDTCKLGLQSGWWRGCQNSQAAKKCKYTDNDILAPNFKFDRQIGKVDGFFRLSPCSLHHEQPVGISSTHVDHRGSQPRRVRPRHPLRQRTRTHPGARVTKLFTHVNYVSLIHW